MRKFLMLFLISVMIMTCFSGFTAFADYTVPEYVRIGLLYGSSAPAEVTLESDYGFLLGDYEGRTFYEERSTAAAYLTVKIKDGEVVALDEMENVLYTGRDEISILADASGMRQKMKVNGIEYRGGIHFIKDGERLTVVNVVFLDHYLYGVISREMSPSWHKEALKAQAVCARNYAINSIDKHKSLGFDLCSSVDCQAYSGTKAEANGSYAPVDETSGEVLTYDGKIAKLFYSSSMGPTTEDVKNVWGSSYPYLVSVDNSFEDTENIPNGIWNGFLSAEEATTIMRNKGYDVGDVTDIKVLEYTENDRVLKMEVVGTKGSKIFERESCRTIFNNVTKSQMFTVKGDGQTGAVPSMIYATDGTNTSTKAIDKIVILSAEGRGTLNSDILYTTNGVYQKTYESYSTESGNNTGFYFEGSGWGHGVGMSQYGAKGMAEKGYDYTDILLHYFTGTNLENAY